MPPEKKPNQFARIAAVLALLVAFIFVVAGVASSGGGSDDSDDGDDGGQTVAEGTTAKGDRALEEGVWIVREGDTLVSIAEQTGVDIDELEALNPEADPQSLVTGQRIALVDGLIEEPSSGSDTDGDTINEGAGIGDGTGEGDGGPTQEDPDSSLGE